METSNKNSHGGFHVIGLMVAELLISTIVITLGIRIGFGTTIVLLLLSVTALIYIVPKLHQPKVSALIFVLPKIFIVKLQIKPVNIETSPSSIKL